MVRTAHRSLYGTINQLKLSSTLYQLAGITTDDDELWELLVAASDVVDNFCDRHFYPLTQIRYFDGDGSPNLTVDNLLTLTTLKEDTNGDQSFDTTHAAATIFTRPYNNNPSLHTGRAITNLQANPIGSLAKFTNGQRNFEIAGIWGFNDFKAIATSQLAEDMTPSETDMDVDSGTDFEVGQTLVIGSEQILVTAISSNTLTIVRAMNGSTAAAMTTNDAISIQTFPAPIARAALLTAARLYVARPDLKEFYLPQDLDLFMNSLLNPYRRPYT